MNVAGSNLVNGLTDTGSDINSNASSVNSPVVGSNASGSYSDMVDFLNNMPKFWKSGDDWWRVMLDPFDFGGWRADARERAKLLDERMWEAYKLDRQTNLENTAVQRRMADLKAAGLNPLLAGMNSLLGANPSASASGTASSPSNSKSVGGIAALLLALAKIFS